MAKITKPIIILGSPRSGTTFLFTLLNESKELHSLYEESRFLFRDFYQKYPDKFTDDALKVEDLDQEDRETLINNFHLYSFHSRAMGQFVNKLIKKKLGLKWLARLFAKLNFSLKADKEYRLVEKTPRNAFKVDLLNSLFPDALFVYIKRDGRSNISSLIEAWKKRELDDLEASKRLPQINMELNFSNYDGKAWRFTLPPGWQEHINSSLEQVSAFQWKSANDAIQESLKKINSSRVLEISYEELVTNTEDTIQSLCDFAQIKYSPELKAIAKKSPTVNYFDGKPSFDKWKKNADAIANVSDYIESTQTNMGY